MNNPGAIALPLDHLRGATPSYRGARCPMALPPPLSAAVDELSEQQALTRSTVLLAAFKALLVRISGQDDIAVGFAGPPADPAAGVLVLRTDLGGDPGFRELLKRVAAVVREAREHRDPSFQVLFELRTTPPLAQRLADTGGAGCDLTLSLPEDGSGGHGYFEYNAELFDATTILRLRAHFTTLLAAMVAAPEQRLSSPDLLTPAEHHQLLVEWRGRIPPVIPEASTLYELFAAQAERRPDAVAMVSTGTDRRLSYGQLDERSNQLAHHLRALGVGRDAGAPETVVGIAAERGPEVVVGLLGILKAGGVYLPLDPAHPADRLAFMLGDAGARVLLVGESVAGRLPPAEVHGAQVVSLDGPDAHVLDREPTASPELGVDSDALAYVIYTSGTTGVPKGVAVSHRQVLPVHSWFLHYFALGAHTRVLQNLSHCFDFGLFELVTTLLAGGTLCFVPEEERGDLGNYHQAIERHALNTVHTTPSWFRELMVRGRLPGLEIVHLGGEAIGRELMPEIEAAVEERCRVYNGYGPTETSINSTVFRLQGRPLDRGVRGRVVPIGRPTASTFVYVLDRRGRPLPVGVPGELAIGGEGLARTYLNRPALTAERFVPDPHCRDPFAAGARLYRSGDLVRWLPEGDLEFLDRIDQQVKIRGLRVELGEIEGVLGRHPAVRQAVVLVRVRKEGERWLVAYVVPHEAAEVDAGALRAWVGESLPVAMVPNAVVFLDALPRTPTGKVDRRALPDEAAAEGGYAAPRNPQEELLAGIWAEVLSCARVGIHDDFFALGGHSLLATRVLSRLPEAFGVSLPVDRFFELPTVAALARALAAEQQGLTALPLVPVARDRDLPLSFAQQRLWFLDQVAPRSAVYNIPAAFRLGGRLRPAVLARSLGEIMRRHEALRTRLVEVGGEPRQVIAPPQPFSLPVVDLTALGAGRHEAETLRLAHEEARRPFRLADGRLLRAGLLRLDENEHLFLLDVHHVAADGWSMGLLHRELEALYGAYARGDASPLPELDIQYADFAVWQREWLQGEVWESQLGYWREQLRGMSESLELPADRPRPPHPSSRGATLPVRLGARLSAALRTLGRAHRATLFMTLLSALKALLCRFAGDDDVAVGSPVANRNRPEIEGLIGFFVNTLVLRTGLAGDPLVTEVLERVRKVTLGAYSHQDLPFEKLVAELQPQRDLSRQPLVQELFVLQNTPGPPLRLPELVVEPLAVDTGTAKFNLALSLDEEADGGLSGFFEYSTDLFDATTIRRLAGHFTTLLAAMAATPDRRLSSLGLLTPAEHHQLLVEWRSGIPPVIPEASTLHGLFAAQAERRPDAVAMFSSETGRTLSYGELDARGNQLAHHLRALGVGREAVVGLAAERGPEVVVGLLGILKAGGVYLPLDLSHPVERLAFMLRDADARVLLVGESVAGQLPPEEHGPQRVALDGPNARVLDGEPTASPELDVDPDTLAYVIYTSGTTGMPKGVAVSHRQVLPVHCWFLRYFALGEHTRVLQNLSYCFDFGVFELTTTILSGGTLCFVPEQERGDLGNYHQAIERHALNTVHTTPSWFRELMVRGRLPGLEIVHLGGEAIGRELMPEIEAVVEERCRVYNGYGPTETSINSTVFRLQGRPLDRGVRGRVVPIGRPTASTSVYVLDRRGRPLPVGVPGELAIGGEGVARTYLNRPALTAERFVPDPHCRDPLAAGARLYRSGDLVRWLPEGDLEFLDRIDQQVKIRGLRVELGEIEGVLGRHPAVRQAVVLVRVRKEGERWLVAYVVPHEAAEVAAGALRAWVGESLPAAMVPNAVVFLHALPRTPTGKVDRRALPAPDEATVAGGYAAPRNPQEELLAGIWAEVLSCARVGIHDDFFALGGHSLLATRVLSRLPEAFGVSLPVDRFFELPTVAALARALAAERREQQGLTAPPLVPVARDRELPLSFAQQRLWFLDQVMPESAVYNIPAAFRLGGRLRPAVLARSLGEIVRRHEALRTRLVEAGDGGEPRQVIAPPQPFSLPVVDLIALGAGRREAETLRLAHEEARRPFRLADGRLLRAGLLRLDENEHLFLLNVHHVAADGWSMGLLYRELEVLYGAYARGDGSPLPELDIQYADFAIWQRQWLRGEVWESQLGYWRGRLEGMEEVLELPTDRPRPPVQSYCGAVQGATPAPELVAALGKLSRALGTTLFMTLLAAFQALVARYAAQDDVTVGTAVANRNRAETEGLIGFFVNTLLLRTDLHGDPTFRELLDRVREVTLGAYAHQDLPFEKVVEDLQPQRDLSRQPLFQVMFVLQNTPGPPLRLPGPEVRRVPVDNGTAKFDLTLYVDENEGGLRAWFEYNRDLFDRTTIQRLLTSFLRVLEGIAGERERRLSELPLLPPAAAWQLLGEWNDKAVPYSREALIHQLFELRVEENSEAVALAAGTECVSYRELDRRANRLAHHLRSLGVGPEQLVGVCLERAPAMVVGILAILKAGGAYLPLDPGYPQERLAFMLDDAGVRVLLSEESLLGVLPEHRARVVRLHAGQAAAAGDEPPASPTPAASSSNLAYLIYTSGSTGRAKGVAIAHRSAVAMLEWAREEFTTPEVAGVLAATSICFDLSVFELFVPLSRGGTVILAENALALPALPACGAVSLVNTVPSALRELLRLAALPPSVRAVNLAGEALPRELVEGAYQHPGVKRVLNLYGPSEDTTYSTWARLERGRGGPPPIGRPVSNTRAYVLDRRRRPVPPGVPGELFLAGAGLARCYLDRPRLTAERWLPDPFAGRARGARMYRTGDLVRALPDGELAFLGRLDHQVKVRGFRIELGEVEAVLRRCPAVLEGVVLVREEPENGERRLVAYLVPRDESQAPVPGDLRAALAETLPEHMVPAAFVALPALPLTANGKVDRRALARLTVPGESGFAAAGEYVAPRTPTEEVMAGIWSRLLGRGRIGLRDHFFELGGHSLLATRLISRVRDLFGVEPALRAVFQTPTLAALSERVERARGAGRAHPAPPIRPPAEDPQRPVDDAPLSFAQQRLWFLAQLVPDAALYNIPLALRLRGPLNRAALAAGLGEIVRRHQVLRSRFAVRDGEPYTVICPPPDRALPVVDLTRLAPTERPAEVQRLASEQARRPFDLSRGPFLRALLLHPTTAEHLLLLTMHHAASDGWSLGVLNHELSALYAAFSAAPASELPEPAIQYSDYARWQREWLRGEVWEAHLAYWRQQLAGLRDALELPADRPRPPVPSFRGAIRSAMLPETLSEALRALGRGEGTTLFMTLLAAFDALLARSTGTDEVTVGSPIANRNRSEIEELIGFFVNVLPLRVRLAGNPSFRELLARVREVALDAYAHQDLPFEKLVEELQPQRDLSRQPLFQVVFALQSAPEPPLELAGVTVTPLRVDGATAKFDLTLFMDEAGSELAGGLEYSHDLFDSATIERMLGHFRTLLAAIVRDPGRRLSELPLLTRAEHQQLLVEWNETAAVFAAEPYVHRAFEARAAAAPAATAVVSGGRVVSYGELNRRANGLAHTLSARGVGPDLPVGIFMERSPAMVVAILGVLKAGGAYLPLDPASPPERLAFMLRDAAVRVLLSEERLRGRLDEVAVPVLCLDGGDVPAGCEANPRSGVRPENPAYVIYTSGSTGRPKGTELAHAGLANLVAWHRREYRVTAADRATQLAGPGFDAAVWEVWPYLTAGAAIHIPAPEVVADPRRLLEWLAEEGITLSFLPTPLAEVVLAEPLPPGLRLRALLTGGDRLHRRPGRDLPFALVNHYGPTENTVVTTWTVVTADDRERGAPPIGRPLPNHRIYLLDPGLRPVPVGVAGELHAAGPGLARGYLGRPALTAASFIPNPCAGESERLAGERLYKTGDLARYLPDGRIGFLGRIDHQVKIRGFRIELGEIEAVLGGHPTVREAVVLVREEARAGIGGGGERRLVAYVVAEPGAGALAGDRLRAHLAEKLPESMVPAAFVELEALPLTPNGKVDRSALSRRTLPATAVSDPGREGAFAAPRTPAEELMAGIWMELLGDAPGRERIGVHDDFFALGGHSLLATQLVSRVRDLLAVELPVRSVFQAPTIAALSARAESARRAGEGLTVPPIRPLPEAAERPLSFAQQRLWFLAQLEPDAAIYNIPRALRLGGALHRAAIEAALNEVVHRHEALRTRLVGPPEGEPYQVICEPEAVFCPLPVADLNALAAGDREPELRRLAVEEARRPFDLAVGLPLRATLLGCGEAEHLFLLTIHHVAADGWSMGILHRELAALYDALSTVSPAVHGGLPELPIQYADFARWQRQWLRGRVLELQLGYWKEQLAGIHGALELPADRPRPVIPSYRGALGVLELPAGLTEALKALSRRQGSTLFMTLLAAFAALLYGTTGEDDVSVGSPIANRNRSEIEGLIGFFVNTLLLRTRLTGNPSFAELVARVREVTLGAYAHQDLPFEKLVEELQPERDLSRQPLFQVMFILQNAPGPVPELRGLTVSPLELDAGMAKFDLTLGLTETEGALTGELEYATDLYDATTAQRFLRHYRNLLESAAADPERRLDGLSTLSAAERHQLFVSWNDTGVCYPWEAGIHELFEAQVTRTPDAVAVVFGDRCWSYRELETRANRLAHHLQSLGVGPDVTVGVALERSPEVVQALFGVLKAGGVYLPLDRSYPADRLEYMLSDARAEILVTRREPLAELPPIEARPVLLDADRELIARASPERPASRVRPENLSYLVYTSGSTGRPKGVALVHRTLTNLIAWQLERRGFAPGGRTAQFSALSFDASVHEIPSTLSSGGTLFLVTEEERRDPRRLVELMATHGVERLFLPFVALQQLAEAAADKPPHALREVITAGEQLQVSRQVEHFFTLLDRCTLDNHYGPSESHVVTAFMLRGAAAGWPALPSIGRPVANFRIYLLDRRLRPVALGVPGELFLNGEGLARGYYGRPDLTAEKFVPDPFGDRTGGARMYATGDLGRFAADGTIEFLGRIDHQVKIRGFRIEPGEIETALSRHPAVREAAVLVRGDAAAGEKRLVAYVVAEGEAAPSPGELRDHLGTTLPDYMVPAIFVALETLPLLPSGKVNRRALPAPEPGVAVATGERVAPRDPVEEILTRIWSQVLGIEGVGIRDDFFALGGHSLLATQVQSRMRHELGIELPLRLLFEQPTVADLAGHVAAALRRDQGPAAPPLRPAARTGPVVLSFAQQRLWFLAWLEPEAAVYSVPEALRLRGPLRRAALEAAINAIVHRHEALRTRFVSRQGEPYQEVRPPVFRALPVVDATALAAADRELEGMRLASAEADRSFDLERGPLLRAFLVHAAEAEHVLVLNQHHVVSDAWSLEVFNRELAVLYEAFAAGESAPLFGLPELEIQYADFAIWQRQWLQGEVLEAELAFWKEQLAGAPEALELPADRPRPATQSYRGTTRSAVLDPELAAALKALSRQRGGTPFMTLLAAFEILLARFTGEQDLSVGTHIANRNRSEIEGLIGFFVNTLVLRTDLEGDPGFEEVLRRVREVSLRAYAHQDLPFEKLVEELRPERDLSRHPFFQVAFQLLNVPASPLALAGIEVSPLDVSIHVARFDVELAIMETPGELVAVIEYSTDLFDATTILRLLESYSTLLAAAVDDPQRRLSELPLLAPAAEQQLFVEWNDTGRPDPGGATIPALFEAPAVANPDITAVVAGDHRLSYRGLNRRANRLARHLRTLGVGPETLVGICLERSAEMVVAILGVLKAGGAYLPLDPEYPRERLAFMLDDAKALLVLTEERLLGVLPDDGTRVLRLDRDLERQAIAEYRGDDLVHLAGADNLAYLIYTSGSTGRAKAVAIEHRSAVAMVEWTREVFAPEEIAAVLASTSICFDLSVFELFVPLSRGGTVILAATALDLPALPAASEVTLINTVPSAMTELLRSGGVGPGVRTINLAGEPLRRALVDEIAGLGTAGRVLNLYGPSEDTTYSTSTVVPQGVSREPTIGRPVAGTRSYLVDRHLRPVPAGVVGELLLAGEGLARGYLDRPEQTASRFVPDPLSGDPRSARPGTLHLSPSGGTRTYRTGDLARFAPDGELEFLGRIDHQVKVRGFRIELGEIEAALGRHPGVRDAVVVAREDEPGDPRLVAYLVPGGDGAPADEELRAFLRTTLPEYMVPVFVVLEALPLTPNGKVDRRALPAPERTGLGPTQATLRNPVEEAVAGIWSEVLRPAGQIGGDDDFFALGGHSLLAIRVLSRITATLRVELPARALFTWPTVAGLAGEIERRRRAEQGFTSPPLAPVPRDGDLPLSFAEQRMWFLDHFEPGSSLYNISAVVRLRGRLRIAALERTLSEIVRRHESLRTVFPAVDGRPRRVIAPPRPIALPIASLERLPESEREPAALRLVAMRVAQPFDLATGPLLRAGLVRLRAADDGDGEHLLWFSVHHAVTDAWSMEILIREVAELYNAFVVGGRSSLSELPIQVADYAHWQRRWLEGEVLAAQLAFWRRQLGENPPPLVLPGDRPRPPAVTSRGALIPFELPAPLAASIQELSREHGASPFFTLLAAFQALLGRYAGQDRVTVGTPVAGRGRAELEGLIGLFVNTLALGTDLSGDPPFHELVARVRRVTLEALDHQDTPFDKVVDALQKERDPRYHPLVQVLFNYQHGSIGELKLKDLTLRSLDYEITTAKFDLTLGLARSPETLGGSIEYNTDLFDADTITRFIGHYRNLLENVAADPARRLSELAALQEVDRDPRVLAARSTPAKTAAVAPTRPSREDRMATRRQSLSAQRAGLSEAQKALLTKWTRKRGDDNSR